MKDKNFCCDCGKKVSIADTFVFEGQRYCMNCLYSLIMSMYDSGIINIDMSSSEDKGMIITGC